MEKDTNMTIDVPRVQTICVVYDKVAESFAFVGAYPSLEVAQRDLFIKLWKGSDDAFLAVVDDFYIARVAGFDGASYTLTDAKTLGELAQRYGINYKEVSK